MFARHTRLLPAEWAALAVLAILLLIGFVWDPLIRQISLFIAIPLVLTLLIAILLAMFAVWWAFLDYDRWPDRLRAMAAMPLALLGALLFGGVVADAGRRTFAALHLATHGAEMIVAQARAGAGRPVSLHYVEGFPDGGVSIIRSPAGRPEGLSTLHQIRLTGERIRRCGAIGGDDYVCSYD